MKATGRKTERARAAVFYLAALALPAALALASGDRGHRGDMACFRDWYLASRGDLPAMYRTPRRDVNYPVLGALQAVAPGRALEALDHRVPELPRFIALHKLFLAPWNSLLIALLAALGTALGTPRPRARAIALWALPWAWVGGLYFGQIDVVPAALQLAAAVCAARYLAAAPRGHRAVPWLAAALVCLQASLLAKQLALFAAPSLLALALAGTVRGWRAGHRGLAVGSALAVPASFCLLRAPDAWLRLPHGWHAHLAYVYLAAGPPHAAMMGNAPGLWSYLGWAPEASSLDPIALEVTPRSLGLALFLGVAVTASLASAVLARRRLRAGDVRGLVALALVHGGLVTLAAATLLAGAHERYLYPAWALLLPGLSAELPRRERAAWVVAGVYGLFVLSTVAWDAFALVFPLRSTQLVATLVLGLLGAVTVDLVRASLRPTRPPGTEPLSSAGTP